MSWFRRNTPPPKPLAVEPPGPDEALAAELLGWIDANAVPGVSITRGPKATDPRASFLGGHAYLPDGAAWPDFDGDPAHFVCQVNFGEVPPLAGFPASGLLQWFVKADRVYGITFDETAGATGFTLRWYADTDAPSRFAPDATSPKPALTLAGPTAWEAPSSMLFGTGRCLPPWSELSAEVREQPLWVRLTAAYNEDEIDVEAVYENYVREFSDDLVRTSLIGGRPNFIQDTDPRGNDETAAAGAFPTLGEPDAQLLVQLGADLADWGDSGIGHLFGDPAKLASGDLSGVRYYWRS